MQIKIDSELIVISKTDEIMNDQVLMWTKQGEALRTQMIEAEQTKNEMRKVGTCKYVDTCTHPKDVQCITRHVVNVAERTILVQSAELQDEQHTD